MAGHEIAWWAAASAFFGTLLAIGAIDILNPNGRVQFVGGVLVGVITGGAVYAKQRLDDAKQARVYAGTLVVTETEERAIFSLELDGEPEDLKRRKEVVFKVQKKGQGG